MYKIAIIFFLMGTGFVNAQSELAKYQNKIKPPIQINDKATSDKWVLVDVQNNSFASPYTPANPTTSKRNIFNLTEKGQKAYIDALNSKTKDVKSFIDALPTVLEPTNSNDSESLEMEHTEFLKKLEIDVTDLKSVNNPAGRIAQLVIWITLNYNDSSKSKLPIVNFS